MLFIGEAPGVSEDILGKAFVGDSGRLLDGMLTAANIPADACFFTNVVLCRPCDDRAGQNREPREDEVFACLNNVFSIVGLIHHEAVVLVGAIAKKYYAARFMGSPILEVTHPAAILRVGGRASSLYIDNVNKLRRFYAENFSV
jgi:uracil-DNA glycosylase family 4